MRKDAWRATLRLSTKLVDNEPEPQQTLISPPGHIWCRNVTHMQQKIKHLLSMPE